MQKKVRALTTSLGFSLALLSFSGAAHADQSKSPSYWQCVTFAREFSGIQLFGDASTWWQKAQGKYTTGQQPSGGAVLVFRPQGRMSRGHVAVVSQVVTERLIKITHANWSPVGGRRGRVENDVSVLDVSERGDWSRVKVWYGPLQDLGTTVYSIYGFIYASPLHDGQEGGKGRMLVAANDASESGLAASGLAAVADMNSRPAALRTSVMVRFPARTDTTLSADANPQANAPLSIEAVLSQRDLSTASAATLTKATIKSKEAARVDMRGEPRIVSSELAEKLTGQKVKTSLTKVDTPRSEALKATHVAKKTRAGARLSRASTKALRSARLKTR